MGQPTVEQIAERATDLELLTAPQSQELLGSFGTREATVDGYLQAAVGKGFLTNYQVDRLLKGERDGYFYGDYKVLYLVGAGTFARVFRAVHRESGDVVAVKVLRKRFSDIPIQYTLFVREGELGCSLRHPNIVPIFEVHSQRGAHFFVLEFVEGRNLREFMKIRKVLEPLEATRLMADIANGLSYAFQRSVMHRDLKLSNVLVSSRGQAKLLDFGLAALDDALGEDAYDLPNTRTIDYAALERATGVRKDDPRSDVYFAGCIYYHMLTGRAPLPETIDRVQRLNRQRFAEIIPIERAAPQLPQPVAMIVHRAMAFDPVYRYQTPTEMSGDLQRCLAKLADGAAEGSNGADPTGGNGAAPPAIQRSVMVVTCNTQMQDVLREGLKKAGHRVLVTSDPQRAVDRVSQDPHVVDCVLFVAQELGENALDCFNRLGQDPATESVSAILLLEQNQRQWKPRAEVNDHRLVVAMPLTMKQLRSAVGRLLPPAEREESPAQEGSR